MGEWRDNVQARQEWEQRTGGTVTRDESGSVPLWRARDAEHRELTRSHDLGVVMDWLDRLEAAERRRVTFAVAHPDARFWTTADGDGPVMYHASMPVQAERIEPRPQAELGQLMDVMDALAARAARMRDEWPRMARK